MLDLRRWISPVSGSWHVAENWEGGILPGPGDDVLIDVPTSVTVTHSTGSTEVNSLENGEGIELRGGVLNVQRTVRNRPGASVFRLAGGTLRRATLAEGTYLRYTNAGGTLDAITVRGFLFEEGVFARATVVNGLTVHGEVRVETQSALRFEGTQRLDGTGTVQVGFLSTLQVAQAGTTLTFGPGITVRARGGTIGYNSALGGSPDVAFVNEGTILQDAVTGPVLTLEGTNWGNAGTIVARAGEVAALRSWSNRGVLRSEGTGTLRLEGSWSAGGVIHAETGTRVELRGAINNVDSSFTVSGRGTLRLSGTVTGGVVEGAFGSQLTSDGGRFNGTTLNADVATTGAGVTLDGVTINSLFEVNLRSTVLGGLTLNGTVALSVTSPGRLEFTGTQTLSGTGMVVFGFAFGSLGELGIPQAASTLTIGPRITVRGYAGFVGSLNGGRVRNEGTIRADVSGLLTVRGAGLDNFGRLEASNQGVLVIQPAFTNRGTLTAADSGRINLGAWTCLETCPIQAATGGTVEFTGAIDNTNGTLALSGLGTVELSSTVTGGTLTASASAPLLRLQNNARLTRVVLDAPARTAGSQVTFDAVTLNQEYQGNVTVVNGLVLNGYVASSTLEFQGTQTLAGSGTFSDGAINVIGGNSVLTIGPDILIRMRSGRINAPSGARFINQGTIRAEAVQGTVTLGGTNWRNEGVLEVVNGGTLVTRDTWTNTGTIAVSGGTLTLGGTWSNAGDLTVTAAPGSVVDLAGTFTNTGANLFLDGRGQFRLTGTIRGGTIYRTDGAGLLVSRGTLRNAEIYVDAVAQGYSDEAAATLDNVRWHGNLELTGSRMEVFNGLTFNGALRLQSARLRFVGSQQTLSGSADLVFEGDRFDSNFLESFSNAVTFGPDVVIRGGTLNISGRFVNRGTILADRRGFGGVNLDGIDWRNDGLIKAVGGTVNVRGTPANYVGGTLTGGSWHAAAGGQLSFINPLVVRINAADLERQGDLSSIRGLGLSRNAPTGRYAVGGGAVAEFLTFDNAGVMEVGAGSRIAINFLTNYAEGRLTGGTYLLSGLLEVGIADIRMLAAHVFLRGSTAGLNAFGGVNALANLTALGSAGILGLEDGRALTTTRSLTNAGVIAISTGSVLAVGGDYTQTGVTLLADGVLAAGLVDLQAGALTGSGIIVGSVRNNALLEVGGSGAAGVLIIDGDYTQTADGALALELGDLESDNYDRLVVTGAAELDGALLVALLDDFTAREDDGFTLLTAAAVSGTFTTLDLPKLGEEFQFEAFAEVEQFGLTVVRRR